jgi:hypothetical protein
MITALLLLPVIAVLLWLYWYLLPRERLWTAFDSLVVLVLMLLAAGFHHLAMHMDYEGAGPMWPELVSAAGVYPIFAIGLGIALAWRKSRAR